MQVSVGEDVCIGLIFTHDCTSLFMWAWWGQKICAIKSGNVKLYLHLLLFLIIERQGQFKSFLIEDILHNQYHGCWWPDNTGNQGIKNHGSSPRVLQTQLIFYLVWDIPQSCTLIYKFCGHSMLNISINVGLWVGWGDFTLIPPDLNIMEVSGHWGMGCHCFMYICMRLWLMNIVCFNTLRPRQDGCRFPDNIFNAFSYMKMFEFPLIFHWSLSPRLQLTISSIGSDNGLAPTRRQAIIWTNDDNFTDAYMPSLGLNELICNYIHL